VKVDADGNEEWNNVNTDINGSDSETEQIISEVQQTSDGGFIAGGIGLFYNEVHDYMAVSGLLWKVDETGLTEWLRWINNAEDEWTLFPFAVEEVDDGFICAGMYIKGTTTNYFMDIALFETDDNGNLEWYKEYDVGGYDMARNLFITEDGGYFVSGCTMEPNSNVDNGAFYMLKTDSEGNKQWDKIFDGPNYEYAPAKGCCQTSDGGYIMCGASGATSPSGIGNNDLWIIKTNAQGTLVWDKTFGGSGNERCYAMSVTDDGGYVFCVCKDIGSDSGTKEDIWLIKTDNKGNAEWKFQIEEEGIQHPSSMVKTDDGGFIIGGRTGDMNSKSADGFIVKISSFENQRPNKPSKPSGLSKGEPDTKYTFTTSTTDPDGDSLTYMWDWGDGNYSDWLETSEASHTWATEDNFKIRVMAKDIHGGESEWSDPFVFSTPKDKAINIQLILYRFFQRFPLFEKILNPIIL
jgi:hypothetical protein